MTALATAEVRANSPAPRVRVPIAGAAIVAACVLGAALPIDPRVAAIAVAPLVMGLLVALPSARLAWVIVGGLVVLQTSQTLDETKIIYLSGSAIALLAAMPEAARSFRHGSTQLRRLVVASLALGLVVFVSAPLIVDGQQSAEMWLRGGIPYLLYAVVPILAMDAGARIDRTRLNVVFLLVSLATTLSYGTEWLARRGLAELAVRRFVLPSVLLPGALFSFAVAGAARGTGFKARAALLAGLVFGLMLLTGSRSNVVLLAAIPAEIAVVARGSHVRKVRLVGTTAALSLVAVGLIAVASSVGGFDSSLLSARLGSIQTLLIDPSSDMSFAQRTQQTSAAVSAFMTSPFIGVGPGYIASWDVGGVQSSGLVLDSPALFLMRFGMLGIGVLVANVLAWLAFVRTIKDRSAQMTLAGTWGIALTWMLLGSPFDDKGFSFGLLLVLAISLASARTATGRQVTADTSLPSRTPNAGRWGPT